MTDEPQPSEVVKVARDLHEIERLAAELEGEAVDDANAREMPGGKAMVALGPVASLEAWENRYETAERLGRDTSYINDHDDDLPVLQTLRYWSEDKRRERGEEREGRWTIESEAGYLRSLLNFGAMTPEDFGFDAFAEDIKQARLRLENIVHNGKATERSRVVCDRCKEAPRLIRVHAREQGGDKSEFDGWKCKSCKVLFTEDDRQRAYAKQLRSEGAERFVPLPEAVATLHAQGRPIRTIRKWLAPSQDPEAVVEGYCDLTTRRAHLWWPTLWTRHLLTQTRERVRKSA